MSITQEAFLAGVAAVDPTKLVKAAVRTGALDDWFVDRDHPTPIHVIALGKAAPRMVWGLVEANAPFVGFGAAPAGLPVPEWSGFKWYRGGHPIPDATSFAAGAALLEWVARLPEDANVLVLLSGGASACCETPEVDAELWRTELRSGRPIEAINADRAARSHIKGGRLAKAIKERTPNLRVWVLQDTAAVETVGSGPCADGDTPHVPLATVEDAIAAVGAALPGAYRMPGRLSRDVDSEMDAFMAMLQELPDDAKALVAGGEPTLAVPTKAPRGGRNHHAALLAAKHLSSIPGWRFLAAGTDGIDGDTLEAGADVTGADWSGRGENALASFDAYSYLSGMRRTFRTGQTGTNVNDIWIALKE